MPDITNTTDLLPVHQERGELWVDARTLHATLKVGRDFSNWIRGRLEEVDAKEDEEFIVLDGSPDLAKTLGGRPRRDYWLHLDLAKEVAMMERSEIGKAVRRYFIEAEKRLRRQLGLPDFTDPVQAARAWADAKESETRALAAQAEAQQLVQELTPQAEQFQALMSAQGTYSVGEAAKTLGMGELKLFRLLRDRQILMDKDRSGIEHHNVPYQRYLEAKYFEVITRASTHGNRVTYTTRVTPKGLAWLERHLRKLDLLPAPLAVPA